MSTRMFIPMPLRRFAGERSQIEVEATSVHDALRGMIVERQELRDHLFSDDGALRPFASLYVNADDIRVLDGKAPSLEERDTVGIVPAVAGGARR